MTNTFLKPFLFSISKIPLYQGAVEVGNPLEISFQFTPPKELCDIGSNIEFHTMLSLKGETTESFRINFVAKIVAWWNEVWIKFKMS